MPETQTEMNMATMSPFNSVGSTLSIYQNKQTRTRRNKRNNLRGGVSSEDENILKTSRLLIVNNALEATVLGGANLFSAPEWTVVCNSGDHDGGEKLFYKNMSKMGIYEYYYGYGANSSVLKSLACKPWCLLATTNSEFVPLIQDIFMQEPHVITVSDTMLSQKLNRYKSSLVRQNEKLFEKEDQESQAGGQHGGVLPSDIVVSIQQSFDSNEKPEAFAEFLTRDMFTVQEILKKMNEKIQVKSKDGQIHEVYNNILYLPETTSNRSIAIFKSFLENPFSKQMDMLFFDNRPTPAIPEQYFYKIDLDEPIIIRTSDTTRKMIALLDSIDDLETLFSEGYQFLSSLRITPLNLSASSVGLIQQGGRLEEFLILPDNAAFDEMDIAENPFMALVNPTFDQSVNINKQISEFDTIEEQPIDAESQLVPSTTPETYNEQPIDAEAQLVPSTTPETYNEQPIDTQPQQGGRQKRRTIKQRKYKANSH